MVTSFPLAALTFGEEMVLAITDKLVIGIVIVLIGFVFSRLLERYKARQAVSVEVAKARVKEAGEVWKKLYSIDSRWEELELVLVSVFRPDVDPSERPAKFQSDFMPKFHSVLAEVENARRDVRERHFWLGNAAADFERYLDSFGKCVHCLVEADHEHYEQKYKAASEEHAALRKDAINLLERIVEAWK
jgi:hypothetical protein